MVSTIHCPNCGAPAQTSNSTCSYCHAVIIWPGAPPPTLHGCAPAGLPPGVVEAMRAGNKLKAIHLYQAATKSSLLDSKNAMDDLEKKLG